MIRVKVESGIYEGVVLDVECVRYEDLMTENVFLCTVVESDNANRLDVGSLIYSNDSGLLFESTSDVISENIDEFIEKQIEPILVTDEVVTQFSYKMSTCAGIKEQIVEMMDKKVNPFQILLVDKDLNIQRFTIDTTIFE